MDGLIKKIAFLEPRSDLSYERFRHHWRHVHGPLVANSPGYSDWRLRYVQNHVVGPAPVGKAFPFAGMAEFWLPGASPNEDDFSATEIYRELIAADERNFIDMERTISFAAKEQVLLAGKGSIKVVIVSQKAKGLDERDLHAKLGAIAQTPARVRPNGWRVDHVIKGSFRLPGAGCANPLLIDCMESLWFDDEHNMSAYFAESTAVRQQVFHTKEEMSFRAEEHVLHDVISDQ
jgi:uncharacterized protein (TIGR02118 family)